jgi:hypothetical protein
MPVSSSTDTIMASVRDIVTALQNPSPRTPLAPRTDTQTQALLDTIVKLLTNLTPQPSDSVPDTPLRVDTPSTNTPNAPPLRVEPPGTPEPAPQEHADTTPSHTPTPPSPEPPHCPPDPTPAPATTPDPPPAPTPDPSPAPPPDPTPDSPPAPTPEHIPVPPQEPTPEPTYTQVTGPTG